YRVAVGGVGGGGGDAGVLPHRDGPAQPVGVEGGDHAVGVGRRRGHSAQRVHGDAGGLGQCVGGGDPGDQPVGGGGVGGGGLVAERIVGGYRPADAVVGGGGLDLVGERA